MHSHDPRSTRLEGCRRDVKRQVNRLHQILAELLSGFGEGSAVIGVLSGGLSLSKDSQWLIDAEVLRSFFCASLGVFA